MEGNLENLVYFPFSIIAGIWLLVVIYGKCNHPKTEGATAFCAGLGLIAFLSWLTLILYLP